MNNIITAKTNIAKNIVRLNKREWTSNGKLRVLIQTNKHFSEDRWSEIIKSRSLLDCAEFQYAKKKFDFIKLAKSANVIFCYGMSKFIQWNRSGLKLVYFGLNGIEYVDYSKFNSNTKICYAQGFATEAIAEYTLLAALILNRNMQYALKNNSKKLWSQSEILSKPFCSISTKLIGIMGLGKNGSCIAKKFKQNNCKVYAYDKNINYSNPYIDKWFQAEELQSFLKEIDILIVALPLNKKTYHFLNEKKLKLLKPDCYIINVSRGNIIDEKSLITMLKKKRIAGAMLDVFSSEPLSKSSKLWGLSNVIVTPHIAGNVNLFVEDIQVDFIKKLSQYCINV